jgi:hypothetical protein
MAKRDLYAALVPAHGAKPAIFEAQGRIRCGILESLDSLDLLARPSIRHVFNRVPKARTPVADRAAKAEPIPMLPGFRSLSIAVVLAVSMLIFGLGAAALLRATHEEFASLPLKQMPEVTFGSREEQEAIDQPTLAVLQVETPTAEPAPNQAEAQHPVTSASDAQPESTTTAPPATDAPSVATDGTAPAASPPPPDSAPPAAADSAPPDDAAVSKPSEPPPGVEPSIEAGDAVKPDIAAEDATDAVKTDVVKPDIAKPDVEASDVVATMTSPFGEHFRAPLPVSRPAQAALIADPTSPTAKPSSAKPPRAAKRHHHRRTTRHHRRSSRPQFAPD